MKRLVNAIKNDNRFSLTTYEKLAKEYCGLPQRVFTPDDLPAVRDSLSKKGLFPLSSPSLSLCDMFFGCADFLNGKTKHICGIVYGPMDKPTGIKEETAVFAKDIRLSAATIDPTKPIPPAISVGGKMIGPADWLYAALQVLEGKKKITLLPMPQLPCLDGLPLVKNCSFAGTWRHSDDFKDAYLSARLRYQSWTMRFPV